MRVKQILLIDDNEIDNYINKHVLISQKAGEEIKITLSGEEALEYLFSRNEIGLPFPELIFLDINMPGIDGFGFLQEFEKFPAEVRRNSTIYMLTSSQNPDDIIRARQNLLVKDYLEKPLTKEMWQKITEPEKSFYR
jgi:CheY-like chemotaxis protein